MFDSKYKFSVRRLCVKLNYYTSADDDSNVCLYWMQQQVEQINRYK